MYHIDIELTHYVPPPTTQVELKVNHTEVPFDMVRGRAKPRVPIYPGQYVQYTIKHSGGTYNSSFYASSVMEYAW